MTHWWWLSFVDPDRPEGQRSLGVAIVQGADIGEVASNAWALDCNPGGEVAGAELPDALLPAPEHLNRLHGPADARELAASIDERNRRAMQ